MCSNDVAELAVLACRDTIIFSIYFYFQLTDQLSHETITLKLANFGDEVSISTWGSHPREPFFSLSPYGPL